MNARSPIPEKVRLLVPVLSSPHEGEVVGTARAIGRVLGTAGLTYHDLAAAIPTAGDAVRVPEWDAAGWRAANPAPAARTTRRKVYTFTPAQSAAHRKMALYCRDADRGRLSPRERDFVSNVASWRRELTIAQADWLGDITDRLEQEDRRQWQ